jgi:hypothetical protein
VSPPGGSRDVRSRSAQSPARRPVAPSQVRHSGPSAQPSSRSR